MKYLGRKHDLVAQTESEQIRIDLMEAEANDLRYQWVCLCYLMDFVSIIFD